MIEIANFTGNSFSKTFLEKLEKIVKKILFAEKIEKTSLSVVLVGSGRMRKLNKKYRKKNRITDVLSFPAIKSNLSKPYLIKEIQEAEGLGEIVICPGMIKKNAKRLNLKFEQELARCLIHGTLHLLGYNHKKNVQQTKIMQEKAKKYLLVSEF